MKFSASLLFFLLLGFSACKYSEKYSTVEVNKQFSLDIPSWLKEDNTLKEGAPFQYANRFRNFYTIAESVPCEQSNLQQLSDANIEVVKKVLDNPLVTDSVDVNYNNAKGVRVEILGAMDGEKIYFSEVMLQGGKSCYHLSIWTRSEERKLRFKDDIQKILSSFREL
ncbi:MAG: hypothetical protein KIS94_08740 [Chitinophagales bacterium]|nr:hypothetical protein [Chitinophagales bacterium]